MFAQSLLLLFVFILFPFFSIQTQTQNISFSLENDDYLLFEISDLKNPVYYVEKKSLDDDINPATFCGLQEPRVDLKYFEKVFDQTDPKIFTEEDQLLMIDDKLYVLLSSGILQVFNITLDHDTTQMHFNHYNEINLLESNIMKALNGPFYIKMGYNKQFNKLLVVVQEEMVVINIDDNNKTSWMRYEKIQFENKEPLIKAIFYDDFLYLLRNYSFIEEYKVISATQISKTAVLNASEITKNDVTYILDFDINKNYFSFIENNTKNVFTLLRKDVSYFSLITNKPYQNISFEYSPKKIYLTTNKLFILVDADINMEYFLYEYQLNSTNNFFDFIDVYHIDYEYADLYINDFYLFASYKYFTTLLPHALEYPSDLNRRLKIALNVERVREIQGLKRSIIFNDNNKNNQELLGPSYFTAAIGDHIGMIKAYLEPGRIICKTHKFTPLGNYSLGLKLYHLNCNSLEDQDCKASASEFYSDEVVYNFQVIAQENSSQQTKIELEKNEDSQGLFLGLALGFGFSVIIMLCCYIYVRKIKKMYLRNNEEDIGRGQHVRVMSKEELDEIELTKKRTEV